MRGSTLGAVLLLVTSGLGVARTQPRLAAKVHAVKESEEVYTLPPPAELHVSTLGWDAAAVDLIWAQLLVTNGQHWSEHREFRDIPKYVDAILELEPTYALMYKFVGSMLAYRPLQGTADDVRKARAYLERGTRERPYDAALWREYGTFVAFIAPSFLPDEADREAFRKDGAAAMGHAVELGAEPNNALSAANVLTRAGATDAAIRYLERAYALTPSTSEVHELIGQKLAALQANAMRDAADATLSELHERWQKELPFVTRDRYLLLGPKVDVEGCSGPGSADSRACARDWVSALAPPASSAGSP